MADAPFAFSLKVEGSLDGLSFWPPDRITVSQQPTPSHRVTALTRDTASKEPRTRMATKPQWRNEEAMLKMLCFVVAL